MVISSFISSILVLALGIWAYMRLETTMNLFAERQLLIEPNKFSYKMWKDMPVSMYQSFTFFNLTNWNQVKAVGQKPRFVEVGPYVYRTVWSKTDVNFMDDDKFVNFGEKKQWHFQAHLSRGHEDDLIWTINTPLMTALALIQNAPVITRNIVGVILDGLGEGAFIKRPIRSLLFEGYSDLIVSVGPLFDRRFANFNGKFAYLYNKNDTIDGQWTVATGLDDLASLNKITRYQSSIVNMTSFSSGQMPQGLNEVKAECAPAWSLDQSTNGQLFAPFNRDMEQLKLKRQLQQIQARTLNKQQQLEQQQQQSMSTATTSTHNQPAPSAMAMSASNRAGESIVQAPKRFFSRISSSVTSNNGPSSSNQHHQQHQNGNNNHHHHQQHHQQSQQQQQQQQQQGNIQDRLQQLEDFGKFIFYPDLCRPIHLLPSKQQVVSESGIGASRYFIDPRVFMNSSQFSSNKCYEMNPRPPLANALAATINSVTGANVNVPNLVAGASSPFALFIPPTSNHHHNHNHNNHHHHHHHHPNNNNHNNHHNNEAGLFERAASHHPNSFLNNALHSLSASANQAADQLVGSATSNSPIGRLGRVRQLFSNIVSQRMSANPLLPSLSAGPASLLMGTHHHHHNNHNNNNNHHHNHLQATSARQANSLSDQVPLSSSMAYTANPLSRSAVGQDVPAGPGGGGGGGGGNQLDPQSLSQSAPLTPAATANLQQVGPVEDTPTSILQQQPPLMPALAPPPPPPMGSGLPSGSDRWITQFRFKWPRGVFSIGQCQLGAPIYVSLPHFLDADEYYLEQVDGLKPNRSLHEFYIDVESTLHSIPVGAKARLQLNIATPELRFRNIPNAMIPVLWQEVTFKIDKPIATMLYWSFTMSSTIYKSVSILLLCAGAALMMYSFVGGFKRHNRNRRVASTCTGARCDSSIADISQICDHDHQACDRLSCTTSGSHRSSRSCATSRASASASDLLDTMQGQGTTIGQPLAHQLASAPLEAHSHLLKLHSHLYSTSHHHLHHPAAAAAAVHQQQQQQQQQQQSTCNHMPAAAAGLQRQVDGVEGRRSSWQHIRPFCKPARGSLVQCKLHNHQAHCNHSVKTQNSLDDDCRLTTEGSGAVGSFLNHAYASSCNEIHMEPSSQADRRGRGRRHRRRRHRHGSVGSLSTSESASSSSDSITTQQNLNSRLSSPKQSAWSRASSHCELMSSFGTTLASSTKATSPVVTCSKCLFACLRHSAGARAQSEQRSTPNANSTVGEKLVSATSDISSQLVRQQQQLQQQQEHQQEQQQRQHLQQQQQQLKQTTTATASDNDNKATLSSLKSSNLDSCSSIFTARRSKKFTRNN